VTRRVISTDKAPAAIGPYSQAVLVDGWLWCSGQVALDPSTGTLVGAGTDEAASRAQARQALTNLGNVVAAAGGTLRDVVRCTLYLADMGHFAAVNEVYAEFFPPDGSPPARATVEVSALPKGAMVEVDCVARVV
jgi:reactive intermediate/imine deaminase